MNRHNLVLRLPTSGQILGALVTTLGIKHPELYSRTARRYFSGDSERLVKDSSRENIIQSIAEALIDAGFVASPQSMGKTDGKAPSLASTLN